MDNKTFVRSVVFDFTKNSKKEEMLNKYICEQKQIYENSCGIILFTRLDNNNYYFKYIPIDKYKECYKDEENIRNYLDEYIKKYEENENTKLLAFQCKKEDDSSSIEIFLNIISN